MKHKSTKELRLTKDELDEIKFIFDELWKEDIAVRQQCLIKWKRLKLFWNNITNTWYDSVAHDWRVWDGLDGPNGAGDQAYYDNRVNVFRAYLESIIAALSVTVPPVRAYPDDAENSADIETAKAGDKISELIYRHNDVTLLWVHNLYVYMTEGFVATGVSANYNKEYGTYEVQEYTEEMEPHDIVSCPNCGFELSNEPVSPEQIQAEQVMQQQQQMMPPEQDMTGAPVMEDPNTIPSEIPMDMGMEQGMDMSGLDPAMMQPDMMGMQQQMGQQQMGMQDMCPSCGTMMTPQTERTNEIKKVFVGSTKEPKGRVKLVGRGGLNIKIPLYARNQDECFYLFDAYECHKAQAIQLYPELHDDLQSGPVGGMDSYEQYARLSCEYRGGSYPQDNVTVKTAWFKPAAFNLLVKDKAKHWKKKYPNGISVTYVNDTFACAKEQELDKQWTLIINPLSDFIQNDPIGMLLVSIQEITNDLISLRKQTIEHGVGLTFVDPAFIDLNAYGQTEVLPGSLIPTKTISGNKKLSEGIYEVKTATLSGEVGPFAAEIQQMGQLVSGAMPALFGDMNSETAAQDSMSKNQAMSRLGNIWKMFGIGWKNTFGKAIPLFIELIQVDERDVQKRKDGSFINVLIRKAELAGKIGKVELEANENIPMTWSQKKDVVMQLLLSPNPQLLQMIMAPENLDVLREAIGIDGFYVTGEDDRDKQYNEIQALLESEPIQTGMPMMDEMTGMPTGQMEEVPSIEVDELMDNHVIQFEICRKWAISESGQLAKIENEAGYKNVLLHAKQHLMILNIGDGAPTGTEESGASSETSQNEPSNKNAPNVGDSNAAI